TSPFLTREDIDGVTTAVTHEGADTAVTVAPFHGFLWRAATADAPAAAAAGGHGVDHVDAGAAGHDPVPGVGGASAPGLGAGADLGGDAVAVTAGGRRVSRADAAAEAAAAGRGPVPDAGAASAPEWGAGTGAPSGRGVDDGSRGGPVAAGVGGRGVNHDKSIRPRRQDRPQAVLQTGPAYPMDAAR